MVDGGRDPEAPIFFICSKKEKNRIQNVCGSKNIWQKYRKQLRNFLKLWYFMRKLIDEPPVPLSVKPSLPSLQFHTLAEGWAFPWATLVSESFLVPPKLPGLEKKRRLASESRSAFHFQFDFYCIFCFPNGTDSIVRKSTAKWIQKIEQNGNGNHFFFQRWRKKKDEQKTWQTYNVNSWRYF